MRSILFSLDGLRLLFILSTSHSPIGIAFGGLLDGQLLSL
jgi:hypothetical protein